MKDLAAISVEVDHARAVVDRIQVILERASRARTLDQALDRVCEARRELADLAPRLARIVWEEPPFVEIDPYTAAYFAKYPRIID
jgi:hypothetical protein